MTFLCGCPTPCLDYSPSFSSFSHTQLTSYFATSHPGREKNKSGKPTLFKSQANSNELQFVNTEAIFTSEWERLLLPLSEGHFSPCLPVGLLLSKNILVGFHSTLNLLPTPIKRASCCPLCTISHCDSLRLLHCSVTTGVHACLPTRR